MREQVILRDFSGRTKMDNPTTVSHEGVIERITGNAVMVRFVAHSACSACHARGVCNLSDSEEKIVEVKDTGRGFKQGEKVEVILEEKQGFKALAFGYIFPLILVILVLVFSLSVSEREGFSALLGLGTLVPYYLIIWIFRKRITRSIVFNLKKLE